MPTTSPAQTLLDGLSLQVERDGEGWKVIPGDIAVVGVKEVSHIHHTSSTTGLLALLPSAYTDKHIGI